MSIIYKGNDIYCDLIIPGKLDIKKIFETDEVLAYYHTRPAWPTHIIVIPKKHISSLATFTELSAQGITSMMRVVAQVAKEVETIEHQCRVMTNLGDYQTSKHLHWLIVSGEELSK
jgi:histidine triad (HIT) family protein